MRDDAYVKQYDDGNSNYENYCQNYFWHIHSVGWEQQVI
jgi:hypothetical protein